jgi:hypothetical protein
MQHCLTYVTLSILPMRMHINIPACNSFLFRTLTQTVRGSNYMLIKKLKNNFPYGKYFFYKMYPNTWLSFKEAKLSSAKLRRVSLTDQHIIKLIDTLVVQVSYIVYTGKDVMGKCEVYEGETCDKEARNSNLMSAQPVSKQAYCLLH